MSDIAWKSFPSAKLLMSLNSPGIRDRPLTPLQAAQEIKTGMESLHIGKSDVARLLGLSGDKMVSEILSLLDFPPSIWDAIGWEGKKEGKIGPDIGYTIAQLSSLEEREYLAKVFLDSDMDRVEIRATKQLRKANPNWSIDQCLEKIVKIRPVVVPGFVIVTQLSSTNLDRLSAINRESLDARTVLTTMLTRRLGEGSVKRVSLRGGFAILTLSEEGRNRFKKLSSDLGVKPESILDALVEEGLKRS